MKRKPPVGPDSLAFARRLLSSRKVLRLSQQQLAKLCAIDVATLRRYEKGTSFPARPETLLALCRHLGVSVDYLVGFRQNDDPSPLVILVVRLERQLPTALRDQIWFAARSVLDTLDRHATPEIERAFLSRP
jgi:transcriptional regulator with XRE-family HTH domain